jgi:hypothetical protein
LRPNIVEEEEGEEEEEEGAQEEGAQEEEEDEDQVEQPAQPPDGGPPPDDPSTGAERVIPSVVGPTAQERMAPERDMRFPGGPSSSSGMEPAPISIPTAREDPPASANEEGPEEKLQRDAREFMARQRRQPDIFADQYGKIPRGRSQPIRPNFLPKYPDEADSDFDTGPESAAEEEAAAERIEEEDAEKTVDEVSEELDDALRTWRKSAVRIIKNAIMPVVKKVLADGQEITFSLAGRAYSMPVETARIIGDSPWIPLAFVIMLFLNDYGPTSFRPADMAIDLIQSNVMALLRRLPFFPTGSEPALWKRYLTKGAAAIESGLTWGVGAHVAFNALNRIAYGVDLVAREQGAIPSRNVMQDAFGIASKLTNEAGKTVGKMALSVADPRTFLEWSSTRARAEVERDRLQKGRDAGSESERPEEPRPRRPQRKSSEAADAASSSQAEPPAPPRREEGRTASPPPRKVKAFVQQGQAAAAASPSTAPSKKTPQVDSADEGFVSGSGKPKTKEVLNIPQPILEYFDVKNDPHFIRAPKHQPQQ